MNRPPRASTVLGISCVARICWAHLSDCWSLAETHTALVMGAHAASASAICVSGSQQFLFLLCNLQIAMKELRQKKIPFTIRRYLPDGRYGTS